MAHTHTHQSNSERNRNGEKEERARVLTAAAVPASHHSVESRRDQGKRPKFAARIYPSHTFRCASVHCVANEASKAQALSTRSTAAAIFSGFLENASPNQNLFVTAI